MELIHVPDGFDIDLKGELLFDELQKSIIGFVYEFTPPNNNTRNIDELTLSFAKLPLTSQISDSVLEKINGREEYMQDTYSPRLFDGNFRCQSIPPSTVPLKKRPLPTSLNVIQGTGPQGNSKPDSTIKGTRSLNEFLLERMSKSIAARKKKMKFQTVQDNKTSITSPVPGSSKVHYS